MVLNRAQKKEKQHIHYSDLIPLTYPINNNTLYTGSQEKKFFLKIICVC